VVVGERLHHRHAVAGEAGVVPKGETKRGLTKRGLDWAGLFLDETPTWPTPSGAIFVRPSWISRASRCLDSTLNSNPLDLK
jgi:hypothetical protein